MPPPASKCTRLRVAAAPPPVARHCLAAKRGRPREHSSCKWVSSAAASVGRLCRRGRCLAVVRPLPCRTVTLPVVACGDWSTGRCIGERLTTNSSTRACKLIPT